MLNVNNAAGGAGSASPENSPFSALLDKAGASSSTRKTSSAMPSAASASSSAPGARASGKTQGSSGTSPAVQNILTQTSGLLKSVTTLIQNLIDSFAGGGKAAGTSQSEGGMEAKGAGGMTGDAPTESIADIASGNDDFEILTAALEATGLDKAVAGEGDLTVFAPTDDAFRTLASETLGLDIEGMSDSEVAGALVDTLGVDTVTEVLKFHVSPGGSSIAELQEKGGIETLNGETIDVQGNELVDKDPDVENPRFVPGSTDIGATNGTVQAIDRVLLPFDA